MPRTSFLKANGGQKRNAAAFFPESQRGQKRNAAAFFPESQWGSNFVGQIKGYVHFWRTPLRHAYTVEVLPTLHGTVYWCASAPIYDKTKQWFSVPKARDFFIFGP
jgi:hypothetical protein